MRENNSGTTAKRGIGFISALTLLFIALKLTDKIHWSWWWVLSPLWISFIGAVVLIIFILSLIDN